MAENIYFEFSHEDHARGIDQTSSTNYIEEVLANMHREQSDHLYCKFSEAYIKVKLIALTKILYRLPQSMLSARSWMRGTQ